MKKCLGAASATVLLSALCTTAFAQPQIQKATGDFTLQYKVSREVLNNHLYDKDKAYAIKQYDDMYRQGKLDKLTHDSMIKAQERGFAKMAGASSSGLVLSNSKAAFLTHFIEADGTLTSLYTRSNNRTFGCSNKADLTFLFQGARSNQLRGLVFFGSALDFADYLKEMKAAGTPGLYQASFLDTTVASKTDTYRKAQVKLHSDKGATIIDEVKTFLYDDAASAPSKQYQLSDYVHVGSLFVPKSIVITQYEARVGKEFEATYGKPTTITRYVLSKAVPRSLPASAFALDTYLQGRKGMQFDDGKKLVAFPYEAAVPIDDQIARQVARDKKAPRSATRPGELVSPTGPGAIVPGAILLVALSLAAGGWFLYRRLQTSREAL